MVSGLRLRRLALRLHVRCPQPLVGQQQEDRQEHILSYNHQLLEEQAQLVDSKCHQDHQAITKQSLEQTVECLLKLSKLVVLEVLAMATLLILRAQVNQEEWDHPHII